MFFICVRWFILICQIVIKKVKGHILDFGSNCFYLYFCTFKSELHENKLQNSRVNTYSENSNWQ